MMKPLYFCYAWRISSHLERLVAIYIFGGKSKLIDILTEEFDKSYQKHANEQVIKIEFKWTRMQG